MKYEDIQNELMRLEQLAEDADKAKRGTNYGLAVVTYVSSPRETYIHIHIGMTDQIKVEGFNSFEEGVKMAERQLFLFSNKDRFLAETLGIAV